MDKGQAQAMQRLEGDFKKNLSQALRLWINQEGYSTLSMLSRILNIDQRIWGSIMGAETIVEKDKTVYARLFLWTNLSEANPKRLPSKTRFIPSLKVYTSQERAWSEEQWQEWLRSPEAKAIKTAMAKGIDPIKAGTEEKIVGLRLRPHAPKQREQHSRSFPEEQTLVKPGQTIGSIVDLLVSLMAKQVGTELAPLVAQSIMVALKEECVEIASKVTQSQKQFDPGQLAKLLRAALLAGSPHDREKLFEKFGDPLFDLLPVLDAYCNSKEGSEMEAKLTLIGK